MTETRIPPWRRLSGSIPAGAPPHAAVALRLWLAPAALLVILFSQASAQNSKASFDYVSRLPVPADASLLARGDFNGDSIPDLLAAGAHGFSVYLQGATSFDWSGNSGTLTTPPLLMSTGRINGDSRDDLITYSNDPPAVSLYLSGKNGVPLFKSSIEVEADVTKMIVADLDGDGTSDILLFGKKTLGIHVLRGKGGGRFSPATILHPDISISLVSVARMDDDELPDLVAVNWISNQLLVSSGFGEMNFSDPVVIPGTREAVAVAVGDLDADGVRDIVMGFADRPGISVLTGDGSGRFTNFTVGDLPSAPARIRIGDVDGDAMNDLLIFTPAHGSVSVRYSDRSRPFTSEQVFSTGPDPADVIFFVDARRRLLNAAVLPTAGRFIRLIHNSTDRFPGPAGWEFVTGSDPGALEFADINSDSWMDVILAQKSDRAVNVFLNNGRGNLLGMVSVAIPEPAFQLMRIAGGKGNAAFLATGSDDVSLTFLRISGSKLSGVSRTISVGPGVVAVDAGDREEPDITRIYATRPGHGHGGYQLSAFDVSSNNRYEEIDIPVDLGDKPVGMLSHDFNRDGLRDLAVLSDTDSTGGTGLRIFLQTADGFVADRSATFNLDGGVKNPIHIWAGDFNADGYEDLVFNLTRPVDRLHLSLSIGDSAFGPAASILDGVRVPGRQGLSVVDFNSDGITDLVFVNERTRTIQFLPGDGGGQFSGPVNLMSARNATGIGVADLNRDSEQELLVTGGEQGTLSITSFHHPLFERRNR